MTLVALWLCLVVLSDECVWLVYEAKSNGCLLCVSVINLRSSGLLSSLSLKPQKSIGGSVKNQRPVSIKLHAKYPIDYPDRYVCFCACVYGCGCVWGGGGEGVGRWVWMCVGGG